MGWTEQQIQTLKQMWGKGFSANDIAKSLGGCVTRNAVIGKAHRLKLSASAAMPRAASVEPPSKTRGVVMASIKKVSGKKKSMLRSLPPVQSQETTARVISMPESMLRPIEIMKRSEGIPVTKAGERHCRWPIGDPRSPDFRFCGCDTHEGLPYCASHARVAYQTVSRRSRANANADAVAVDFNTLKAVGEKQ
ncbi:MAG TPA: gcrA cell cycle regulator family protein [Rhodospirillaceae bacterium]|nr:gcrA cell cycle regulator family protein [Rhodospirillaceae bacterium]